VSVKGKAVTMFKVIATPARFSTKDGDQPPTIELREIPCILASETYHVCKEAEMNLLKFEQSKAALDGFAPTAAGAVGLFVANRRHQHDRAKARLEEAESFAEGFVDGES
jgi:hypothetical protein